MLFKFSLCIVCAILIALSLGSVLIPETEIPSYLTAKKDIVAFYNVYAEGKEYDRIVQKQVATLKGSGLLDKLDNVYYATMGKEGKDYNIGNSSKYVHIAHYGDKGTEFQTLDMLYKFCHANPSSKVLYFHDKGSYHYSEKNEKFCDVLNCYVLNPHCIEALDNHDTCGWRLSPIPYVHYSGNFWWAKCDYVNTLIDPMSPLTNQTFIEKAKHAERCWVISSRFFAESWITTGPNIKPADCMNYTIDNTYLFGYEIPDAAFKQCHGPYKPSGLQCQTASTYEHVLEFKTAIRNRIDHAVCRNNRYEIVHTTRMMYGQSPHTYLHWMDKLHPPKKLAETTLVKFSNSGQIYIVEDGELRGIPNLKTFLAFGRDFNEVVVVSVNDKSLYTIGSMLDSVS